MKLPFKTGLRFNILVYLGFLMLTAVILTSFVLFKITVVSLTQLETRRALSATNALALSMGILMRDNFESNLYQSSLLKAYASEISGEQGLERLLLTDAKGKVISSYTIISGATFNDSDLTQAIRSGEPVVTLIRDNGIFLGSGVRELSVAVPIKKDRWAIGGVKATFPVDELEHNIVVTQQVLLAFVTSSTILIMAFGVYYLSRTVIKPIKTLVSATERFAGGDLKARAVYEDETELGALADSFNSMASSIERNRIELEDNIARIEEVNRNLKRTQAELVFSEKLAGVGQLAQGVAHEIGNPLSAVLGYMEILKKRPALTDIEKDLVERSEREIGRINEIIRELLNYSRPAELDITAVDLKEVMTALATLVVAQKRFQNVEITFTQPEAIPSVMCDRNRLLQVLVNLAFNAADSMGETGGKIEIGAAKLPYQPPSGDDMAEGGDLSGEFDKGSEVVELWIRDNGSGIEADNMNRIFDPFFTTKDPGKGTGLGLAVSSRILEQFHARMRIESTPGKGTTCTIVFPNPKSGK